MLRQQNSSFSENPVGELSIKDEIPALYRTNHHSVKNNQIPTNGAVDQ
jgi:hypothetical protein